MGGNFSKSSKIVSIYLYPVKSCGPMKITKSWPVTESGLAHDRSFVIMQGSKVLTQKSLSMLCLIRPQLDLVRNKLTLNYEHETPLTVNLNEDTDFKSSN